MSVSQIIELSPVRVNDRNSDVVEFLESFKPMLMHFARAYQREFDEIYQEAALFMLELWPRCDHIEYLVPYMYKAVKYHLIGKLPRKWREVSLETPVCQDVSIEDTLADDEDEKRRIAEREEMIEKTLHQFLKRLPYSVQRFAESYYDLKCYKSETPEWEIEEDRKRNPLHGKPIRSEQGCGMVLNREVRKSGELQALYS